MREKKIYEACERLLTVCSHCKEDENILIVTDEESMDMGMALWDAAERFPNRTLVLMNPRKMHGGANGSGSCGYAESRRHLSCNNLFLIPQLCKKEGVRSRCTRFKLL